MSYKPDFVRPPATGDWTQSNFGSGTVATFTQVSNSVYLYVPFNVNSIGAGTDNLVGVYLNFNTNNTYIFNVQYNMVDIQATTNTFSPICIGISDGTAFQVINVKLLDGAIAQPPGQSLYITQWTNSTTINTDNFVDQPNSGGSPFSVNQWFMIRNDGSNTHYYLSTDDRQTWIEIYTSNTVTPTYAGVFCNGRGYADVNLMINSVQRLPY